MRESEVLTVLDVGHGNCAVIQGKESVAVVDTARGSALLEHLQTEGIDRVDTVILSHADTDHVDGLVGVLSAGFEVGRVYVNADAVKRTASWDNLVYELDARDSEGSTELNTAAVANASAVWKEGDAELFILAPSKGMALKGAGGEDRKGREITSNSMSVVAKLKWCDSNIALFPGDLDDIGLDDAEYHVVDFSARILVFPHHGGRGHSGGKHEAFAERLSKGVAPETVVFSIGRGGSGNPRPEVVKGVRGACPDASVSCTQLSNNCASQLYDVGTRHLADSFSRGRRRGVCCAGTMRFELATGRQIGPKREEHREFIRWAAESPLCT